MAGQPRKGKFVIVDATTWEFINETSSKAPIEIPGRTVLERADSLDAARTFIKQLAPPGRYRILFEREEALEVRQETVRRVVDPAKVGPAKPEPEKPKGRASKRDKS